MNVHEIKSSLEGNVLQTSIRTLSERELAGVVGGSPIFKDPEWGGNYGTTPSSCLYNGYPVLDDCVD